MKPADGEQKRELMPAAPSGGQISCKSQSEKERGHGAMRGERSRLIEKARGRNLGIRVLQKAPSWKQPHTRTPC
ncbi:hypothetical protein PF007_g10066 [Phytophthora fragariae]|uniref:Uncharacterized protein n=1 Tax=Phytophthora fragariae TaxID=53985 RepID=A0A6A3SEA0_9STRA|nr:hypothetical protein PF007_g10066 [Phytophthora fragariae]KAE9236828.1 hypothetical protein PF004_g8727 [Phytophthora fragariae]